MSALLFLDTETTGLAHDDDVWEVAAVLRDRHGETRFHCFLEHDLDKAANLPKWFQEDHDARYDPKLAIDHGKFIERFAPLLADRPHIVGAVPSFDTIHLTKILRAGAFEPGWHYHLIDIEAVVVGYLRGKYRVTPTLPWDSNLLSLAVGVEPPSDRHTAMGDVQWIMRTWDAMFR